MWQLAGACVFGLLLIWLTLVMVATPSRQDRLLPLASNSNLRPRAVQSPRDRRAQKRLQDREYAKRSRNPAATLRQPKLDLSKLDELDRGDWKTWSRLSAAKYKTLGLNSASTRQRERFELWWTQVRGRDVATIPEGLYGRHQQRMNAPPPPPPPASAQQLPTARAQPPAPALAQQLPTQQLSAPKFFRVGLVKLL